ILGIPESAIYYLGYASIHLGALGVLWVGFSWEGVAICGVSYVARMFGLVGGFHRYFSHRSYKMNRPMQLFMALLGTMAVQKGVIWWSEYHRHHHRFSDQPEDVHSPIQRSFLYSHMGWFLDRDNRYTDYSRVPDLARYPELRWLNEWNLLVPTAYAVALYLAFGWTGVFYGFFLSTILIWHAIHGIGSFGHRFGGYRRYPTTDNSRNKWLLAIALLGEGWHNNHHHYPASCRQGFFWYEIDITYYGLVVLSWFGLVWGLRSPPEHVKNGASPSYDRRMRRLQGELMDLRRALAAAIDDDCQQPEVPRELQASGVQLREWVAVRMDDFCKAAFDLLVEGPFAMLQAVDDLQTEVVDTMRRTLGDTPFQDDLALCMQGCFTSFVETSEFADKANAPARARECAQYA
ncbi:MAG: acyl-CoA desaturase, partial [Deltaproteobacteria bacterium]|nr:acyl-CoA desaturase [Deltaproteobacteria bacterium]